MGLDALAMSRGDSDGENVLKAGGCVVRTVFDERGADEKGWG